MVAALTIDRMAKIKRGRGRPTKPSKAEETSLHVDIPVWLKSRCDQIADQEGRLLKYVVARILKTGLGLEPDADDPDEGNTKE